MKNPRRQPERRAGKKVITFKRNGVFIGEDHRESLPRCFAAGRAAADYLAAEASAPFLAVAADAFPENDVLQMAFSGAASARGAEVLLLDDMTLSSAAVLTKKYRADLCAYISGGVIEFLDASGAALSIAARKKIGSAADADTKYSGAEGDIYNRAGAAADYCDCLFTAARAHKINAKIALDCRFGNLYKAAPKLFARLTRNLAVYNNYIDERLPSEGFNGFLSGNIAGRADFGFAFDRAGRRMRLYDEKGAEVSGQDVYCLSAAALIKKDPFGKSLKDCAGGALSLSSDGESLHFAGILPQPDPLFTALVLSLYIAECGQPLSELVYSLIHTM